MIRLFRITKPFNNLQRCVSIPLLGSQYRPLSTSLLQSPTVKDNNPVNTCYSITPHESEEIDRLILLAKSKSLDSFIESLNSSPSLNTVIFNRILQFKFDAGFTREIEVKKKILEIMVGRGMVLEASSYIPLMLMYGKNGNVLNADEMIQKMKDGGVRRTALVYNTLIKCHGRDTDRIESLVQEMIEDGIDPNVVTYTAMFNAYSKDGNLKKAEDVMNRMRKEGIKPKVDTYNTIISAFAKIGRMDQAIEFLSRMFEERIEPNGSTFKSMIQEFEKEGNGERAIEVFSLMKGTRIDVQLYLLRDLTQLISSTSKDPSVKLLRRIFCNSLITLGQEHLIPLAPVIIEPSIEVPVHIASAPAASLDPRGIYSISYIDSLVSENGKLVNNGNSSAPNSGEIVSNEIMSKSSTCEEPKTNALSERFYINAQESHEIDCLLFLLEVRNLDAFYSELRFNTIISNMTFKRLIQHRFKMLLVREITIKEKIVDIMVQRGAFPDSSSFAPMISLYGKAGDLKKADEMLKRMKEYGIERNAFVYSTLIKCHELDVTRVDFLFQEMIDEGIEPNAISFNLMINAYSKSGDLGRAVEFYSLFLEKGIKPNIFIYNSMIKVYSKLGNLELALGLLNRLIWEGHKPSEYTWTAIKSAFAMHPNRVMAENLFARMRDKDGKEMLGILKGSNLLGK
jgi:pentatricopeptide repeat protein